MGLWDSHHAKSPDLCDVLSGPVDEAPYLVRGGNREA